MNRIHPLTLTLIAIGTLLLVSASALAGPAGGNGKKNLARKWVGAHMQLGEHYLLTAQYDKALIHFEAVASLEKGDLRQRFQPPIQSKKTKKASKKRGKKSRTHVKFRAQMGAATAAFKAGKTDLAEQWAEKALEFAQKHELNRAVKIAEKFLEEPEEVSARRSPTAEELEKRLQMFDSGAALKR